MLDANSTTAIATLAYDVLVAGAGVAGCAAALAARQSGASTVLLIDMAERPGGALVAMGLRQGASDDAALGRAGVQRSYRTTLLEIAAGLQVRLLGPRGAWRAKAGAVVLATGGREQTRGNLALPGTRPSGVLTAGAALRLLAATGRKPGRRAVIAGHGRWAHVVAQALGRAGTLIEAIVPAVAQVEGWPRASGVVLEDGRRHACDLLVLATPLLPWLPPALARAAGLRGVFVAGAARGEVDEREAAEGGVAAGREAAAWALGATG
jgi:NADPH-dependent 2,4-dienoyl-CoA reductase/sulfur reductase-like enzyme